MANVNKNTNDITNDITKEYTVRYYTGCSWVSVVTMSRTGMTGKSTKFTFSQACDKCDELNKKGLKARIYKSRTMILEQDIPTKYKGFTISGNTLSKYVATCANGFVDKSTDNIEEMEKYIDKKIAEEEQPTEEQADKRKDMINSVYGMTANSDYMGVKYPEKDDCIDCILRANCKHKLTLQFNDKCEMKQPANLYIDTDIIYLQNIKYVLEKLFEKVEHFKGCYFWTGDNGNNNSVKAKINTTASQNNHSYTTMLNIHANLQLTITGDTLKHTDTIQKTAKQLI